VAQVAARSPAPADRVAPRTPAELHQWRNHHQVFLDLSSHYEEHCRRSGQAESPALCAAADRFRRERSLSSLLAFADHLDELDIPTPAAGRKRRI
jgi:hypothetical protein